MNTRHLPHIPPACAALLLMSGCTFENSILTRTSAIEPPPWFEDVIAESGIDFVHDSGHRDRHYFPECVCGGGALFDLDNNGWLDAYLIQSGPLTVPPDSRTPNRLYRNLGGGRFEDITEGSGADHRGYGMGVATGDYDNDGFIDLYVTNLGPNVLLRNNGDGTFTDVTSAAGVGDDDFGASAAFFDYNIDGWLDLFVTNYVHWSVGGELFCTSADGRKEYCSPRAYHAPTADVLYRNEGDGMFTDVSRASGIDAKVGNGLGVVCGDFNGNGLPDIYVANDGTRNHLWINLGPPAAGNEWRFEDRAMEFGVAIDDDGIEKAGMGVAVADFEGHGRRDLLVVNMFNQSDSFHRNMGGFFIDATAATGLTSLTRRFTRFGVAFVDLDNDGLLDLFHANGDVILRPPYWCDGDHYAEPNLLWRGTAGGAAGVRFEEVLPRGGTANELIACSRAAAFGDIDNDGGIDILVVNRDGPPHLLRNIMPNRGHWLMLRVIDDSVGGRDAIGATVELRVDERTVVRDVRTAYSYLAASDPRVHFGLGEHTRAESVTVIWPNGERESFGGFDADQIVMLRRGEGERTE